MYMEKIIKLLNSLPFIIEVNEKGGQVYAVGGIVRDIIMGNESDDLDIVIRNIEFCVLIEILKKYGNVVDTSKYENEGDGLRGAIKFTSNDNLYNEYLKKNGVQNTIDIMLPRKECKNKKTQGHKGIISIVNHKFSIYDDLDRRDITINAMAISQDGVVIDKNNNGQNDIKNKKIRAVNIDVFADDPLRMIRIIRQSSKYIFDIDEDTVKLIKDNAYLLSDKSELPRERFLKEFEKMIGKSDLARAVKILVEFGLYKSMFGIDSKISDFNKFDKANSVAEFSYMLFDQEPKNLILGLIVNNITNSTADIAYIETLNNYLLNIKGKNIDFITEINKVAEMYNKSKDAVINSSYIEPVHKEIGLKFQNGSLPKGEHDVSLKGIEFMKFVSELIQSINGEFNPKNDGRKLGQAKNKALQAIYSGKIRNEESSIKQYLTDTSSEWTV